MDTDETQVSLQDTWSPCSELPLPPDNKQPFGFLLHSTQLNQKQFVYMCSDYLHHSWSECKKKTTKLFIQSKTLNDE